MWFYIVKVTVSAALIVAISEIAKRSSLIGGILASVPVISVLAMIWLYAETRDTQKVAALATSVFWLVIPSLGLFISLPLLLKYGLNFYLSLAISVVITVGLYYLMVSILRAQGVSL